MKRVVVAPGVTDLNRGDQSLTWLIKDLLEESGEKFEVTLLEQGNTEEDIERQSRQSKKIGFDVQSPILLHPARGKKNDNVKYSFFTKISWGLTGIKDLFTSSFLLSKSKVLNKIGSKFLNSRQKETLKTYESMDFLVIKGGGFLHSYARLTDLYYLYYHLFDIMLAKSLKKKVLIMPNSFGPYKGKLERKIVRRVLSQCDLIFAREEKSQKYLSKLLVNKEVNLSPDLGFYIRDYTEGRELSSLYNVKKKKVAITMRPYRFPENEDPELKYQRYINEMFQFICFLIEKDFYPVLTAHTLGPSAHENDILALKEVINKLNEQSVSSEKYAYIENPEMNCYDLTKFYEQMDYIVGTRFHSIIFAMSSMIPPIAIAYSGNKAQGIMKDAKLSEYVIEIGHIEDREIIDKFESLVNDSSNVKEKLKTYLKLCQKEKETMIGLIDRNI